MVKTEETYSFATQFLKLNNTSIFNGVNKILNYDAYATHPFEIKLPSITPGSLQFDKSQLRSIRDYDILKKFGLMVVAMRTPGKYYKGQRISYAIKRRTPLSEKNDVGEIPDKHVVQWNKRNNGFRLVGRNADGIGGVTRFFILNPIGGDGRGRQPTIYTQAVKLFDSFNPYETDEKI